MDQFTSQKFRFYAFISMVLLVFVHGYNLHLRYLQPFTIVDEPLTFNTFIQYFLANGIFRFRIPMLFIISGYLFSLRDDKPYGERVKKRLRTLLAPYLLWSAFGILVTLLFEQWSVTRAAVIGAELGPNRIAEYKPVDLLVRWVFAPLPFQLWFIRVLLIYNLMYPWLKTAVTRFPKIFFPVAGFLWVAPFFLWFIEGEGLLFFSLGIWLAKSSYDIAKPPSRVHVVPLMGIWILAAGIKTWLAFNGQFGMPLLVPVLIILHKFVVLAGLVAVWYGCDPIVRFFMNKKWFVWLSAFSFMIYALHVPLINYSMILAFNVAQTIPNFRLLTFILLPMAVIIVCVLTGLLIRSISPKVYGLLTGGRGLV